MIRKIWTNFRNIKIVKFSDDTYGVRKGWIVYKYLTKQGDWRNKESVYTCLEFGKIALDYEKRFVDCGTEVVYERLETIEINDGHLEPENDYYKKGWHEVIRCRGCNSIGTYVEVGSSHGECKVCGQDRWRDTEGEELMAKWEGDRWRLAQ